QRLEVLVARASPVGLEEEHLVAEVSGWLARQIRDTFGWIPLARDAVTERALDGRGATALDRGGLEHDRRRRARLSGEVRRDVVDAELQHHLRVGLHLGRRALAGRVILDRLLEVPGRDAREDRHGVRPALSGEAVTRATH